MKSAMTGFWYFLSGIGNVVVMILSAGEVFEVLVSCPIQIIILQQAIHLLYIFSVD
jgi:hypothetical protein